MVLKFQTRVTDAGKRRRYADSYEACSAETVWRTAKQINGDIRSGLPLRRLAAWSGPVCCVYGALSGYGATLDTISRRLAWRTVHRIEDAAHFPMMDNPQDTYAAVTHDLNS